MQIDFGLGIVIDAREPLAVSLSGGADSALVLYQIQRQCPAPITCYTMAVGDRQFNHAQVVVNLLQWFHSQFGRNLRLITDFHATTEQGQAALFQQAQRDLSRGLIASVFTGVTANPPHELHEHFVYRDKAHSPHLRDPRITRSLNPSRGWYQPYTNFNKQQLVGVYRQLDLMESLWPLTRSCSGPGLGQCGECWSCEERQWAQGLPPRQ